MESLWEDLVLDKLILECVNYLTESLVLFAFFENCPLLVFDYFFFIINFVLKHYDISLELSDPSFTFQNFTIKLCDLAFKLFDNIKEIALLKVKLTNSNF